MNTSIVSSIVKIGFFFMLIAGLANTATTSPVPDITPQTVTSGQLVMVAAR